MSTGLSTHSVFIPRGIQGDPSLASYFTARTERSSSTVTAGLATGRIWRREVNALDCPDVAITVPCDDPQAQVSLVPFDDPAAWFTDAAPSPVGRRLSTRSAAGLSPLLASRQIGRPSALHRRSLVRPLGRELFCLGCPLALGWSPSPKNKVPPCF